MTKWIAIAATAPLLPAPHAHAQQPPPPRFEVASIKENKTNDGIVSIQTQKGRYMARGFTLAALIRNAYRVQEFQIIGGPEWINTERFDVEATFSEADAPQVTLIFAESLSTLTITGSSLNRLILDRTGLEGAHNV